MAVRSITDEQIDYSGRVRSMTWEGLTPGDSGEPLNLSQWSDMSVHAFYISGSGTTMTIQGSNDRRANPAHPDHASAKWETLKDSEGNILSSITDYLAQKVINTWWIRPTCTGGSGNVNVNIGINMVRAH